MSLHVHWHEGLFLLPHHLQLMQRGLLANMRSERRLVWQYPYGVIECRLMRDQLEAGRIMFEDLRVVMPSGIEINPENTDLASLDIQPELARSAGGFNIYLGVPEWRPNAANAFSLGQAADSRVKVLYGLKEITRPDENTGENPKTIRVRMVNARLMLESENRSQMEVLPLLRIQRAADRAKDRPTPDPDFVPPCLLLSGSTRLRRLVTELAAKVESVRNELAQKLARGGLNTERKVAKTLKLRTLGHFAGSLPALAAAPSTTPFEVYLVLRELLGELAAIKPSPADFSSAAYDHDNPLPCFDELDTKIRRLIPDEEESFLWVAFEKNTKGNPQASLKGEHLTRPLGYFLRVKTRMPYSELASYLRQRTKFQVLPASLEGYAIDGAELKEDRVPDALPAEPDCHFFRLCMKEYVSWSAFEEDKSVVLVWKTSDFDLADATFGLYMPVPT